MNIITIDFETYYDKEFSLSKITTEEYVRSPLFEVIGVGVAVDDQDPVWFSGSMEETREWLQQFDWANSFALAHNMRFDGAIMSWLFGIKPKGWLDTLCMARALHGINVSGSLKALAERYSIGEKGSEVIMALGMRRADFDAYRLARYGDYCCNDVVLTRTLFHMMMLPGLGGWFPTKELKVIDTTMRMYLEPELELDLPALEAHLNTIQTRKEALLDAIDTDRSVLMSNPKFASLLESLGVPPPTKTSAITGAQTYAFAKTDQGLLALQEHPDPRVQALVAARLGTKSTLEETRTQRFIDISKRGKLPVPIRYYAAHTGRFGGDDKINLQNLPSRGTDANTLKKAILPPEGYVIIDADSAQIEARIVAWLAGQHDLVDAFENGKDVYKIMASSIYNKPTDEITDAERFVGKTVVLGCGYGMGANKFMAQLESYKVKLPLEECDRIINVYRTQYAEIPLLWKQAQRCLAALLSGHTNKFDSLDLIEVNPEQLGFKLPSGLWQRYEGLSRTPENNFSYTTRNGLVYIYGGKLVENICQAVARCVIVEQMLQVAKRYKVVLTVHDSIVCIAPASEAEEAAKYVMGCMRSRPSWAQTLPLNCEVKVGTAYGLADVGKFK